MKHVRRALFVVVVVFFLFYLITRPQASAGAVRTAFDALAGATMSVVSFFSALAG